MIDTAFLARVFPLLLEGAKLTLFIAASGGAIGFIGGALLGIAQTSSSALLRYLVTTYVTIIRGTPLILQIIFFYLMLSTIGVHISALATAIFAIGINSSAYISQIIRAGISSVSTGQIEAARTLGISSLDITRFIVLPQALKIVVPALGNEFVTLIKESSLAYVIGVEELFQKSEIIKSQSYNALQVYLITGLMYLAMTTCVSLIFLKIEHSFKKHARNS